MLGVLAKCSVTIFSLCTVQIHVTELRSIEYLFVKYNGHMIYHIQLSVQKRNVILARSDYVAIPQMNIFG